jgi:Abnormal spindle-like microcephaly-assoc'd, ASPM-SPD-2-Hydin/CARDB
MRVVITRAPILEGSRVNGAIQSRQFALESILRALSGVIALLVILVTSGCVGVTGKGTTPTVTGVAVEISPSSVTFGNVTVGQSATQTVTLTNNGTEMLTISGISVAGTGFTASGPHLPLSLSPGQSASISAAFKPTAGDADTGKITITSNAVGSPSLVDLSGAGTTAATLTATPNSIAFGSVAVGSAATQTIHLANIGGESVTISKMAFSGTGVSVSGLTVPMKLAAGQTANLTVTYKPVDAGTLTGSLSITSNASDPTMVIGLNATATLSKLAATLTATPNSIAFGSVAVGSEATQTIHLENTGNEAATISKMTISGSGVSVSGMTAPMTLAAGQTANLTVTYKPASAGTLTASLSITSNATDPSVVVGINASATLSTLAATPSSVSFGNVVVGSDTTQTIRLQNIGTSQVTISAITPSVSSIAISGVSPPISLAPGTSATLTAAYKPAGAGSVAGKITVTSNAVGSPTIIDLSATAAAATAQLTPSASSLSFGSVTMGSSGTSQLTVKSTGNTKASISKVTITGTGFVLGSSAASVILDPSQSESYTVNFDPKAAGTLSGTLTISSNAANSPLNIALSGTGVAATAQHTVALTWERSTSSVTGYFVYRGSKPSGPFTQLNSTPEASPTYSDTTVSSSQIYYYYVTAVDSSNIQSADSNEVSVTIPAN